MSIRNRLNKLEDVHGKRTGDACACAYPGAHDVRFYENAATSNKDADADARPADRCGVCGGERAVIKVVYVENRRAA